jgi:molecular chaperone DnaK
MAVVGIDLGTSNSAVAVYRRGRVDTLTVDGKTVMPSCIAVKPGGGLLVGGPAKTRAGVDPMQAVRAIKRQMGDRDYRVELAGKNYTPVEISSLILKKLVEAAAAELGEPVHDAVISVPAYFNNNQKEDTRLAAKQAGVNVLRLLPEPTAAAVAYGMNKGRDQTILVFDLGGGTFDISVLRVCKNKFDVIGIGGDHDLGGEDFDRRLIDLIMNSLRQDTNVASALAGADPAQLEQQIKESAEIAKKELSSADRTEVQIPNLLQGEPFYLKLTRDHYEEAIVDLVDKTIQVTLDTLKDVKLTPDDVDRVVMVGGSTRIPLVQKRLSDRICEPYIADNVDEVVAQGAAIMAANLSSVSEKEPDFTPIEVSNITAHSLGIRVDNDKFSVVIPRGTTLPAESSKVFTTARDNADRTDVVVVQGEEELCANNQQIGGFAMTCIQQAKAGEPKIDVKFTLDADDILKVDAVDRSTGRSGEIVIEKFQPKSFVPTGSVDIESLRIGVSAVGCDDAGKVMRELGLNSKKLKHAQFRRIAVLSQYDLVFINCLADMTQVVGNGLQLNPTKNAEALRQFVTAGGVLYVSDYALANISIPFPGFIQFGQKGDGKAGKVTAEVVDENLKKLVGNAVPIDFNTIYAPVRSVSDDCKVYLAKGSEPILVSFPYAKGHVVYTSFHNGVQVSEKEKELLKFIILQTISLATNTPLVELAESTKRRRK